MPAQLPDLCQGSSIKLLWIHIILWCEEFQALTFDHHFVPHHSLWELSPLQLCKESRQSCDTGWGFAASPLLTPTFCPVTSLEQTSACKCSPLVSMAGFSLAKGSTVMLCIAGTVLMEFSLALVRPLFKMLSKYHTDIMWNPVSLKQEKIAPDSPWKLKHQCEKHHGGKCVLNWPFKPDSSWGYGEFFVVLF